MRAPIALLLLLASAAVADEAPATTESTTTPQSLCGEDKAEGDCPFFKDGGAISPEQIADIKANALPLPIRVENYLEPFNANEPCPNDNIMQGNYTQGQVEAQVRRGEERRGEARRESRWACTARAPPSAPRRASHTAPTQGWRVDHAPVVMEAWKEWCTHRAPVFTPRDG